VLLRRQVNALCYGSPHVYCHQALQVYTPLRALWMEKRRPLFESLIPAGALAALDTDGALLRGMAGRQDPFSLLGRLAWRSISCLPVGRQRRQEG
jgi:hypothetical protein